MKNLHEGIAGGIGGNRVRERGNCHKFRQLMREKKPCGTAAGHRGKGNASAMEKAADRKEETLRHSRRAQREGKCFCKGKGC